MVLYTLTAEDKEKIMRDHVFSVDDLSDQDVEYVLGFLEAYRYDTTYRYGIYYKSPENWTLAYTQTVDKIACFFKYGDDLDNGPPIPN